MCAGVNITIVPIVSYAVVKCLVLLRVLLSGNPSTCFSKIISLFLFVFFISKPNIMLDSSYDRRLRRTMELTAGPSTTAATTSPLISVCRKSMIRKISKLIFNVQTLANQEQAQCNAQYHR